MPSTQLTLMNKWEYNNYASESIEKWIKCSFMLISTVNTNIGLKYMWDQNIPFITLEKKYPVKNSQTNSAMPVLWSYNR